MQSYIDAGLPKAKAESTAKNDKLASALDEIILNASITDASKNPKQGNLLLHLATAASTTPQEQLSKDDLTMLAKLVNDGSIQSLDQLNGELECSLHGISPHSLTFTSLSRRHIPSKSRW